MPYNSSGVYTRVDNSFSNPVLGTTISPTDADTFFDDIDAALNAYYGTSTTSVAIATGSKSFTTQADKLFGVGRYVIAVSDADPSNFMYGRVTAYSGTSLTVNVLSIGGSGTYTDWTIYIAGGVGATGTGYMATSVSSVAIANSGSKTFTTQSGLAYTAGARVRVSDAADPTTNWMEGVVTSYSGTSLVFTADLSAGSGTIASWNINLAGQRGAPGSGDMTSTNNLSDLASPKTGFDTISKHGADVASASTIDLDAASGVLIDVTGTTTITAITLSDGRERVVRFTGALTLTNGASLVLPGGQNITTAAGDYAIFRGYSAGVVRCVDYIRKDGHPLIACASAPIASASTTDLGSELSQVITITGTTTITSFGSTAPFGAVKFVSFSGALVLTHNSTSLILPGAANITTAAGDCLIARYGGSGNWRVMAFLRAAGRPLNSGVSDTLNAGFLANSYSGGSQTGASPTYTPSAANGNFQHITLNGSSLTGTFTIGVPSGPCSIVLEIVNSGSGSVGASFSTAGFTKTTGDTWASTNGNKYVAFILKTQNYSHFYLQALQ